MRRRALLATSQTGGDFKPIIDINNYLTIEAIEDGLTASLTVSTVEYCIDGNGEWCTLTPGTKTPVINKGHFLSFRGAFTGGTSSNGTFTISAKCNLLGNCNSLLYGNEANLYSGLGGRRQVFYSLFNSCKTIISVADDFLPARGLSYGCYMSMFRRCSNLIKAPKLPATSLENSCYYSMFEGCTSLTTAPELPATSLITACYYAMFYNCSSLQYIKALFTTTPSTSYNRIWVSGVASKGTFVKNKNATWNIIGPEGVPSGWTIQKV